MILNSYFMCYIYVIISNKDKKLYTGYTNNLKLRFEQRQNRLKPYLTG